MSEHTQDEFEPVSPHSQDEDAHLIEPFLLDDQTAGAEDLPLISAENGLPPEAQGELNGGPLGCCLGVMIGLTLSLFLAIFSRLYATNLGSLFQSNYGVLGVVVRVLMALLALVFAILCGSFGWKLGKRFYREYELPERPKEDEGVRAKRLQHEI